MIRNCESRRLHNKSIRSRHSVVFLGKCFLKICSKFTGERPFRSVISIKLQSNFTEIALRHGYSPINLLHIFRTSFRKNTSGWLLLKCEKYGSRLRNSSCTVYLLEIIFLGHGTEVRVTGFEPRKRCI